MIDFIDTYLCRHAPNNLRYFRNYKDGKVTWTYSLSNDEYTFYNNIITYDGYKFIMYIHKKSDCERLKLDYKDYKDTCDHIIIETESPDEVCTIAFSADEETLSKINGYTPLTKSSTKN